MVTGPPWKRESPQASKPLQRLTEAQQTELLTAFRKFYPAG
jgi:hypothetical protein